MSVIIARDGVILVNAYGELATSCIVCCTCGGTNDIYTMHFTESGTGYSEADQGGDVVQTWSVDETLQVTRIDDCVWYAKHTTDSNRYIDGAWVCKATYDIKYWLFYEKSQTGTCKWFCSWFQKSQTQASNITGPEGTYSVTVTGGSGNSCAGSWTSYRNYHTWVIS